MVVCFCKSSELHSEIDYEQASQLAGSALSNANHLSKHRAYIFEQYENSAPMLLEDKTAMELHDS